MAEGQGNIAPSPPSSAQGRAFSLAEDAAYRRWRDAKLSGYPRSPAQVTVEIADLAAPRDAETKAVLAACRAANMCLYRSRAPRADAPAARPAVAAFAGHLGLRRFEAHRSAAADGIVALEVAAEGPRRGYIPYTTRPMGWHTDGYYNFAGPERMVRAMLLHCVRDARAGGITGLLDPEIAYLRLRDENPAYVAALMHPQAMTIPASREEDGRMRAESAGPVLVVDQATGTLAMRYTARKREIRWRQDAATDSALSALERILREDPLVMRVRLAPGEGVVCNNVLHERSGFEHEPGCGRLLYRIRSYDLVRSPALEW
jgi:hypothetical protein